MTIKFTTDALEANIIREIAARAWRDLQNARHSDKFTKLDVQMDVTAVHLNGCPLRLAALRDAEALDFTHDILGIRRHLNRRTGKLEDCFVPRFAAPEAEDAA